MKYYRYSLVLGLFLFESLLCVNFGQAIKFKHITVDNGLSQSWVRCITQDKYGFIWVGTDNGLNRFDGYDFVVYKQNQKDANSLKSSCIMSLYYDSNDNVWIGTYNGLSLYDRKLDRFIHQLDWPDNIIKSIFEGKDQNLYINSGNALFTYNLKTKVLTGLNKLNQFLQDQGIEITKVTIDREQNIWIATSQKGLIFCSADRNSIIHYGHNTNDNNSISDNNVRVVIEDDAGRIWIGTKTGLDLLTNPGTTEKKALFVHYTNKINDSNSISEGSVISLLEDNTNRLWIGTENGGLNLLDIKQKKDLKGSFKHFVNNPGIASSLSSNSIHSLFLDNQGNIWVGTFGNGLNILNPTGSKFELYKSSPIINSVSNNHVNTFFEDRDFIWIGTEDGLNRLNKNDGKFKVYKHNPSDPSSLGSNAVWSISKDKKGNLWVGAWAGGLNKFNYNNGTFTRYLANEDKNSLSNNNIFSIVPDSIDNLWIGTLGGGLNYFDQKTQRFTHYSRANSNISGDYIETILISKKGELWFENSDPQGQFIEHFDKVTGKFKHYSRNNNDSTSLSSIKINTLFEDSKGHLWIGTDEGLNLQRDEIGKFKNFSARAGLPDNSVRSIMEDNKGNLWLGTNKGLSKFSNAINLPSRPEFRNYTIEDGLQGNEFISRSCLKDKDGRLYFGGINGFNTFFPDSIKPNMYVPNVVITDFFLFNQHVKIGVKGSPLNQNISFSKEIILTHDLSVFSFKYAAINYTIPEKNQYAFMMEGFENQWNYVDCKREATYTNLNPGRYTFRVKASNNDGVWNEKGAAIEIIILPPWWETLWFRMLVVVAVILLVVMFFYLKMANYQKRQAELKQLVHLQTQELEQTNFELRLERANIEQQKKRIEDYSEDLKEVNELLLEKQGLIQLQADRLEKSNHELSVLNSTKDRFFTIIAHDLRNPFHAVSGFSEILLRGYKKLPGEKIERYLGLINSSAVSGNALLDNLLQWSRTQTGRISFDPLQLSLFDEANNVLILLEGEAQRKNVQIIQAIGPEIMVYVDENMLSTILRNLISNAIKFTNENGKITLEAVKKAPLIEVSVVDTGVGISTERIPLLFKVETNISTKGTASESGTGLGLILCKEFVEKNGGKIWVESEQDKGSVFKFTLPLV